ncbi:MAG: HDIG domain-containing protein [Deltaproteobacteria bacterium]|nr:MAG: HDIG domain-containing protein [Deltaproteobacteria bacterium]
MTEPTGEAVSPARPPRHRQLVALLGLDEGWQRITLMALLVVLLTLFIIPRGHFLVPSYDPGEVARRDVKSPRDLLIPDEELTAQKRTEAEVAVRILYDFDPKTGPAIAGRTAEVLDFIRNEHGRGTPAAALRTQLENSFGVRLGEADLRALAQLAAAPGTKEWLAGLIDRIYRVKVVSNLTMLERDRAAGIVYRNVENQKERAADPEETVAGPNELQQLVREEFRKAQLGTGQTRALSALLTNLLRPSISYNQNETELRRHKAREAVQPVLIQVKKGEIIVREGDRVTPGQAGKLAALRAQGSRGMLISRVVGLMLSSFVLLFMIHRYGQRNIRKYRPQKLDLLFLAGTLLGMVVILKLGSFVATAMASAFPYIEPAAYYYVLPFAAAAMAVRIVLNSEVALIFSVVFAMLVGFLFGNSFELALFALLSSLAGAHWVRQLTERTSMFRAGGRLALFNAVAILGVHLVGGQEFDIGLLFELGFGLCGGLIAATLVSGIIPLVETAFRYTTNLKLVELANMNNPLLRELMIQAPGTYHHSIIVGNLAEAAAETIGANPLLARVAAYYHDIGKAKKPLYFIENVGGGENKHDKLSPSMSALILMSHLKDGVEMAKEHRLGGILVDIIHEHHGTSLMKFFYDRAKQREEREVDEHDYRYPGPKPQTREAAVIMLADAVEAASRTLTDPTPARIQGMVQKIINNIFIDGQLDECELTLKDLHNIAKSFNRVLGGIFHQRIDYPEPVSKERGDKGAKKNGEDRDRKPAEEGEAAQAPAKKRRAEDLKRLGMS